MRILWRHFGRFLGHRRDLLLGFACIPAAQLLDIYFTVRIGDALDRLRAGEDAGFLRNLFLLLVGVAALRGVFRYFQRWWIVAVSRYVENQLKQEIFDKLVSLPFSFHAKRKSGELASRATSDVENVRMFLGPGLMYSAGAFVMVPASLWVLFDLEWRLALAMMVPLALMGLGMKAFTPRLHKISTAVQESLAELSHRAQESFSGVRVVKGYALERSMAERFRAQSREVERHQVDLGRVRGATHALTHAAFDSTFVLILVLGGWAMIDRDLPAGDVFKFIDLTFKVFWPIIALGWIAGMYPRALTSAERIDELLSTRSDIVDAPDARPLDAVRGALRLSGVGFRHEGAERDALSGVDVAIHAGGVLGVVGPTGSGKSTLLLLLGRLHEATRGSIELDGTDVRRLPLEQLRTALGYVPQDGFLFSDSWRANVQFGSDAPLSDERLRELARIACMDEELERFPAGMDVLIGERGVTLSGGQRQRTCIARALARDPRVLVLDDALSAVDTETEARLIENLRRAGAGRTVVVAAHRLSSVRRADAIVVLRRDGSVEAVGRHEELVARPGWYRDTWRTQQMREELEVL
ncbi:MAG: ABC transporter ATP-binding protein [Planctomycetia bacterium]|jgi:ATP-binding cassette subfamily B protein